MRKIAIEKLKLEQKVCKEDEMRYAISPTKPTKIEIDEKINEEPNLDVSQEDLASCLLPVSGKKSLKHYLLIKVLKTMLLFIISED